MSTAARTDCGIFRRLAREHAELRALLRSLAENDQPAACEGLYPRLRSELLAHGTAEDAELYAVLRRHPQTRSLATQCVEMHEQIEQLLDVLDATSFAGEEWRRAIGQLEQLVRRHVREEEEQLFPRAREVIDTATALALEQAYARAKRRARRP